MNIEIITSISNTIFYHDTDYPIKNFTVKLAPGKFARIALHREDGPAVIFLDGHICWYLNGIKYSFDYWCKILNKSEEEINFLKLKWNIL